MIQFLDLKAVNERYVSDIKKAIDRVLESGWYLLGKELEGFETAFARYCGMDYAVGLASGLDALILIIQAYGMGQCDEIIVPSNTYVATVLAVTNCGAEPIFVEPDPQTHLIDASKIEEKITKRTKAIMPVHLYGQMCDMNAIREIAGAYDLKIIDDAAQSHGALRETDHSRSVFQGRSIAYSYYPTKNLGALADAGAVVTNDGEIAEKIKALRNYGSHQRDYNKYQGRNSRMDEMQAAVLGIKLKGLDEDNTKRRRVAEYYLDNIRNKKIILPAQPDYAENHVWHLFVIRAKERDRLRQYLLDNGIQSQIHYPVPPHKQECYSQYNGLTLPIAEQLAGEVLSIPISPVIQDQDPGTTSIKRRLI